MYLDRRDLRKTADAEQAQGIAAQRIPELAIIPYLNQYPHVGNEKSDVKMIAFIDYECPYSMKFLQSQLLNLKRDYIDKGTLQVFFYDLPLKQHQKARRIAQLAHKAFTEEEFLNFIELISTSPIEQFEKLDHQDSLIVSQRIDYSQQIAGIAGVEVTPAFVINHRVLKGLRDYEELSSLINYSQNNVITDLHEKNSCK